ncbi:MAG TPA: acetate/propionate family kinase [Verrucomicrobiae bacterium]
MKGRDVKAMKKAVLKQSATLPDAVDGKKRATYRVLVLNAGSSSLKFAVFTGFGHRTKLVRVLSGNIERIGSSTSIFTLKHHNDLPTEHTTISAPNHLRGLTYLLKHLAGIGVTDFAAVGHRVVHGGMRYHEPQRVDRAMLTELRRIRVFDPEHLPAEIALMEFFVKKSPRVPQIACFDTAFHKKMPRVAKLLPIPRRYAAKGVQRYGFHGLSYAYLMQELKTLDGSAAKGRVILAHLGNGASMAAVRAGQSIDTTMAFTPAAGLVMGTRSGDLDPGLVAFLARSEKLTAAQFDKLVNHASGLLGVSETSSDMRDLLAREAKDVRAAEAVALFCYTAKKQIGAYAAALGGLDTLVFAGGIGENSSASRARICAGLDFLGIKLDKTRNAESTPVISAKTSMVTVRVIRTDEELMIARAISENLDLHLTTQI